MRFFSSSACAAAAAATRFLRFLGSSVSSLSPTGTSVMTAQPHHHQHTQTHMHTPRYMYICIPASSSSGMGVPERDGSSTTSSSPPASPEASRRPTCRTNVNEQANVSRHEGKVRTQAEKYRNMREIAQQLMQPMWDIRANVHK